MELPDNIKTVQKIMKLAEKIKDTTELQYAVGQLSSKYGLTQASSNNNDNILKAPISIRDDERVERIQELASQIIDNEDNIVTIEDSVLGEVNILYELSSDCLYDGFIRPHINDVEFTAFSNKNEIHQKIDELFAQSYNCDDELLYCLQKQVSNKIKDNEKIKKMKGIVRSLVKDYKYIYDNNNLYDEVCHILIETNLFI